MANETMSGTDSDDTLRGGAGDDTIVGGFGSDSIVGGPGNDTIDGEFDSDVIFGDSSTSENLGFETPQADNTWSGRYISGWTNAASDGKIESWGDGGPLDTKLHADDNGTYIELDYSQGDILDHVQAQLDLVDGQEYTITFDATQRSGDESFEVTFNGNVIATITPDTVLDFKSYSVAVTGTSGDDIFGFREIDHQNNSLGALIDNVQIELANYDLGQFEDSLSGGAGSDRIFGQEGDDTVDGGTDNDTLVGGSGGDYLVGAAGNDAIIGGNDNDVIFGDDVRSENLGFETSQPDNSWRDRYIQGWTNAASDGRIDSWGDGGALETKLHSSDNGTYIELDSNGGDILDHVQTLIDLEDGEEYTITFDATQRAGQDSFEVTFNDQVIATITPESVLDFERYSVTVTGTSGEDIFGFRELAAQNDGVGPLIDNVQVERANYEDGQFDDTISGGAGADRLYGQEGDDTLDGGTGSDTLAGGSGDDSLEGGAGNDLLEGETGDDTLDGGDGNDELEVSNGENVLVGGAGHDELLGGDGSDTLDGGEGKDTLDGGAGEDLLTGGLGADIFVFADDTATDVVTDFDLSQDVIGLRGYNSENFRLYETDEGHLGIETPQGANMVLQNVDLADADQVIFHTLGTETDDTLIGHDGEDRLFGFGGNDLINSDGGRDRIWVGEGADTVVFGTGYDTNVVYDFNLDEDKIKLADLSADDLQVQSYGAGDLELRTPSGDRLVLRHIGLEDFDRLQIENAIPAPGLVIGTVANDILRGTGQNELFRGFSGTDRLYGGGGSDVFDFSENFGLNVVYDFALNDDRILIEGGSFEELTLKAYKENDAEIRLDTGDRLVLRNVDHAMLDVDDFLFATPEEFAWA